MPTATLVSYLLCLGAVYLFRVLYRGWAGYYLLLVMIFAPLLILALCLPSVFTMKLKADCHSLIRKGEENELKLRFTSRWIIPPGSIGVRVVVKNLFTGETASSDTFYHNLTRGSYSLPLPVDRCGKMECVIARWECSDLLRFFSFRKKNPPVRNYTVLPKAVKPDVYPDLDRALHLDEPLKPKPGGGYAEEYDLREYRTGDPPNSIHWKLTSKTDRLIVREALEADRREIFLVLLAVGEEDRGLSSLCWLSGELIRRELPHTIVFGKVYPITHEEMLPEALSVLLSEPFEEPCAFDGSRARCIFLIRGGEVSVQ